MVDYSIDGSFDLHFSEHNDFEVVEGREEFEQDLLIQIHYGMAGILNGNRRRDTIESKIELLVTRVAKEYDVIDSIEQLGFSQPTDQPGTLAVEIIYTTGDSFTEIL